MSNLDKKLNSIKIKNLSEEEKSSLWFGIISNKDRHGDNLLKILILKKYMIGGLIALLLVLGGGGTVVASNSAVPGDALFGVDLAVERARISLATSEEKKNELRLKFAQERIEETEEIVKEGSVIVRDADLSGSKVSEIEVDVFSNETTVKIEADDRKYGFTTDKTEKGDIISEIKEKYNLSDEQIDSVISFETEDRESRADDRRFLNSENSIFKSERQKREFEGSIEDLNKILNDSRFSEEEKESIRNSLADINTLLAENPNIEIKLRTQDGIRIEIEDGEIEIKTQGNNSSQNRNQNNESFKGDVRESDDEVFCRGEWRDAEDCDDKKSDDSGSGNNSDDDSDDDNSDHGNSDDNDDDDDHDGEDDDDNSGHGNSDDDDDDDNSGHGNSDDDE